MTEEKLYIANKLNNFIESYEVVDDLGYITNDLAYNEEDNSLIIVTDTFKKVGNNGKD